jgi:hypothetical protein
MIETAIERRARAGNWSYVKALNVSMILLVCAHLLDIAMYQRWNRVLGVPDWLFMLGKASVGGTVYMMNFLPTTLLISKICPDGVETTTFAMLAGVSNFGQQVAVSETDRQTAVRQTAVRPIRRPSTLSVILP